MAWQSTVRLLSKVWRRVVRWPTATFRPRRFGYNPNDEAHIDYEFDPEGAKKILTAAGIPLDGTYEETFTASPRASYMPGPQMFEAVVAYWNAIGLNIERRNLEAGAVTDETGPIPIRASTTLAAPTRWTADV